MEECCKYEPIIVNGKYVGGNIIYCPTHAAAFRLLDLLKRLLNKTDCNDYNHLEVYQTDNLLAEIAGEEIPFPEVVGITPESEDE